MSNLTDALIAAKLMGNGGGGGGGGSSDNVLVAHFDYNETIDNYVLDKSYTEFAEAWQGGKAILIVSHDYGVGHVTEWTPGTQPMRFIFSAIGFLGGTLMGLIVDRYQLNPDNTLAYDNTYSFRSQ